MPFACHGPSTSKRPGVFCNQDPTGGRPCFSEVLIRAPSTRPAICILESGNPEKAWSGAMPPKPDACSGVFKPRTGTQITVVPHPLFKSREQMQHVLPSHEKSQRGAGLLFVPKDQADRLRPRAFGPFLRPTQRHPESPRMNSLRPVRLMSCDKAQITFCLGSARGTGLAPTSKRRSSGSTCTRAVSGHAGNGTKHGGGLRG